MTPDKFRDARKRLGLTQPQVAALLGVARNTITRWETGTHPVDETAARLLRLHLDGAPLPELPPAPGRGNWRHD